jgi:hypothetical protein
MKEQAQTLDQVFTSFTQLSIKDRFEFIQKMNAWNKAQAPSATSNGDKNVGVGKFVKGIFLAHAEQGKAISNKEVLELVQLEYGNNKTTPSCIAWYKNDLRKQGYPL